MLLRNTERTSGGVFQARQRPTAGTGIRWTEHSWQGERARGAVKTQEAPWGGVDGAGRQVGPHSSLPHIPAPGCAWGALGTTLGWRWSLRWKMRVRCRAEEGERFQGRCNRTACLSAKSEAPRGRDHVCPVCCHVISAWNPAGVPDEGHGRNAPRHSWSSTSALLRDSLNQVLSLVAPESTAHPGRQETSHQTRFSAPGRGCSERLRRGTHTQRKGVVPLFSKTLSETLGLATAATAAT